MISMKAIEVDLCIQSFFVSLKRGLRSWLGLKSLLSPGDKHEVYAHTLFLMAP